MLRRVRGKKPYVLERTRSSPRVGLRAESMRLSLSTRRTARHTLNSRLLFSGFLTLKRRERLIDQALDLRLARRKTLHNCIGCDRPEGQKHRAVCGRIL